MFPAKPLLLANLLHRGRSSDDMIIPTARRRGLGPEHRIIHRSIHLFLSDDFHCPV